ncbi:uncharacterized protein LOC118807436 [Colossoma macropomum]|uniref:uncharacterized protein LOC118807436 n=1 Tax=Colossoma macropomum TaxID=42526 RepID=UPI0018656326|nr:uncharacterized protein LOC118807436 [Colossoma macropomum]
MSRPPRLPKNPPPVAPKKHTIVRVGQSLPGMMRSISLPESDQGSGRGEYLNVMRKNGMDKEEKNPTLQSIAEAPNPSDVQVMEEEKVDKERPPRLPKNPPPVAPEKHTIVRVGQSLPGMMRSISLPESDQGSGRGEYLNVMRKNGMDKEEKNPTLRSITEAPNPSDVQVMEEEKVDKERRKNGMDKEEKNPTLRSITEAPNPSDVQVTEEEKVDKERVLVPQRSWDGGLRLHYASTPALPNRMLNCKRDVSTWRNLNECKEDKEDNEDLMEWWRAVEPWGAPPSDHLHSQETTGKVYTEKAQRVKKALLLYDYLLSDRGNALYDLITELIDVAKNLDKVYKRAKIAGITGGTAGAAGVAAAVGGVLLAPLTMGASLAVAAVGVGVAAAGGVTGASAAITNKVNTNMDRKRVEKILNGYTTQMEDVENCVQFINTGMEHLMSHKLQGVDGEVEKVAEVDPVVWVNTGTISAISKSSGVIQGFALGMDMYFTKDDTQKLKKGSETKFAKQIRKLAHQMETTLNELMKVKNKLASAKKKNII